MSKDVTVKVEIDKSRYWQGILYLENMADDWKDSIGDKIQLPYVYCVHDKDLKKDGDCRKPHVHMIIVFPNTTTWKHAIETFRTLSKQGENCISTCQACISVRHCYDYLIHNTEDCKKKKKHLYDESERIEGNNFDIGLYEQISLKEKHDMLKELCSEILSCGYSNFNDFMEHIIEDFGNEYFEVATSYNSMLEKMCKANFYKRKEFFRDRIETD